MTREVFKLRKMIQNGIRKRIPAFIALGIAAVLVGIDQLAKWLVVEYIEYRDSVVLINGVIDFTHWHNNGAAFGILSGQQTLLITVTSVFLAGATAILLSGKIRSKWMLAAITLIISGGVGNLIDRICQGYVVDFIELKFINFAIFNFADICAVVGAFLLFFVVVAEEIREYRAKKACDEQLTIDNGQLTMGEGVETEE
jgi:signal peptidase II